MTDPKTPEGAPPRRASAKTTRRKLLIGAGAALGATAGAAVLLRSRIMARLSQWTRLPEFAATPPLVPHDSTRDKRTLYLSQDKSPADNVDAVLDKLGGVEKLVGADDVVVVKVSAQWWNIGMTNVASVKRVLERLLAREGFRGEIVVIENTHFRLADGSGLSRAWTRPSERNVDVPGWNKMGDLIPHFAGKPVSFVGLVDGGESALAGEGWHDPGREHGVYGGDGRGPIAAGEDRDGYFWDFERVFRMKRSWVDYAQTPLTWPRFTSPGSGLVVDLKDGVLTRKDGRLAKADKKLVFWNLTTANEHSSTGLTCCCKSAMGLVDMSAGRRGTDPRVRDYQSVHYFGEPGASWRMAGPLAYFAREVRTPDLYITCAEYTGVTPAGGLPGADPDLRIEAGSAMHTRTVVAGTDPVAIDAWVARNLLMPHAGKNRASHDLDDPDAMLTKFLRHYREVFQSGTLDPALIETA
jgi:hypothetical protein